MKNELFINTQLVAEEVYECALGTERFELEILPEIIGEEFIDWHVDDFDRLIVEGQNHVCVSINRLLEKYFEIEILKIRCRNGVLTFVCKDARIPRYVTCGCGESKLVRNLDEAYKYIEDQMESRGVSYKKIYENSSPDERVVIYQYWTLYQEVYQISTRLDLRETQLIRK